MYEQLQEINSRPKPFEFYTAEALWADEHISSQMLSFHLNKEVDISSRNHIFIEESVNWIKRRFSIQKGAAIADFGCGPGLYANRLAALGADVTGIDFSRRSIEYARNAARELGLQVKYINCNYLDFQTDKRFDLIIMIMCDFCALSPDQRKTMLELFGRILKPGGAVLLDAYSTSAFGRREEAIQYAPNLMDGFWSAENYHGFVNTFKYEAEKVVLDKYTIIRFAHIDTIYNWLQYFDFEQIESEFKEAGLSIVERYADVAGKKYDPMGDEFAIVARKD